MRTTKKFLMLLLLAVLLGSTVGGALWNREHYVMVDFRFYPREAETLDLRGKRIAPAHYDKLSASLPQCRILWDVPFQGGAVPSDTRSLQIATLSAEDVEMLDYLGALTTVDAQGCSDYLHLLALEKRRPELAVRYDVVLGGKNYDRSARTITLSGMTAEEVSYLQCMPSLEQVICSGGEEQAVAALQAYCRETNLSFRIRMGGVLVDVDTKELTAKGVTESELSLVQCLPELKKLHLVRPKASAEGLLALRDRLEIPVSWELLVCGAVCSSEDAELDLSGGTITDLKDIETVLPYFPDAETLFLGLCGIDNEVLAKYREKMRDTIRVAWTVQCGKKLTARTDDTTFMPVREGVYYFNDEEAYNLRYCEDMVCIDIGHMSIHNIDFVTYMPNLEYLILAHTQLQYIEPIQHCKKLKFLELDWSPIRDLSPLVGCTALEDLNVGNVYASFEPLKKMTWLENLWMIGSGKSAYAMSQALPDTKVQAAGNATVAAGWRDLPNYYAMRDLLGMRYMSW